MHRTVRRTAASLATAVMALLLALPAVLVSTGPAAAQEGQAAAADAWVLLGPGGEAIARTYITGDACPDATVDGVALPMTARGERSADFDVLVCEASLPAAARSAAIDGQPLALPVATPERILVVGDTGCRLKAGEPIQACNDPEVWPLATIAQAAADWRPDLVIHVGDYHYREMACPADDVGCAGSPWGDTWAAWDADFLAPMAPLRRAAPWVVVRGNHEDCARAGAGYFLLVDPRPLPDQPCVDFTDPYSIPMGDTQLIVFDTAVASDTQAPENLVEAYRAQMDFVRSIAGERVWLLKHHPEVAFLEAAVASTGAPIAINATQRAAWGDDLPAGVQFVFAGHVHHAQVVDFGGVRPSQLTIGNSGTQLDPPVTGPLDGLDVLGTPIRFSWAWAQFGFATVERAGSQWAMTYRTTDGRPVLNCALAEKRADCRPIGK